MLYRPHEGRKFTRIQDVFRVSELPFGILLWPVYSITLPVRKLRFL